MKERKKLLLFSRAGQGKGGEKRGGENNLHLQGEKSTPPKRGKRLSEEGGGGLTRKDPYF